MEAALAALTAPVEERAGLTLVPAPKLAVAVARVSKIGDRHKARLATTGEQTEDLPRICGSKGMELVAELEDLNYSGFTMDRPGLNAAMELLRSKAANVLVVAKVDRFARNAKTGLDKLDEIHE